MNAYPLGDLDEHYWPDTQWYALMDSQHIEELALLYSGMHPPILIAITNSNAGNMSTLLEAIQIKFPTKVYAHLSPALFESLSGRYQAAHHGPHYIMELRGNQLASEAISPEVQRLSLDDFDDMQNLYQASYPGHWFMKAMLSYGPYFGIRNANGALVSISGVHVYSERYAVATLGNIVTLPSERGKGLGSKVTMRLCQELLTKVKTIGLNVHAENRAAIQLYKKLGFQAIADYEEMTLNRA